MLTKDGLLVLASTQVPYRNLLFPWSPPTPIKWVHNKKENKHQGTKHCLTGLPATRLNKATLSSAILESACTSVHLIKTDLLDRQEPTLYDLVVGSPRQLLVEHPCSLTASSSLGHQQSCSMLPTCLESGASLSHISTRQVGQGHLGRALGKLGSFQVSLGRNCHSLLQPARQSVSPCHCHLMEVQ